MSILQVGNLHFESTGNNRIHFTESNAITVVANGTTHLTANATTVVIGASDNIVANDIFITFNTNFTGSFIANSEQYRSATPDKVLNTSIWDAAAEVILTDATTIGVNMSEIINGVVTLGGNRTLGNPTNTKFGQTGYIRVIQPGSGGPFTLSYGANWEFGGGVTPVLTTTAGAVDILFYQVLSSTSIFASLVRDVK